MPPINEYVLWFAKDRERAFQKFRQLYSTRGPDDEDGFPYCELRNGEIVGMEEVIKRGLTSEQYRRFSSNALFSQKSGPNDPVVLRGKPFPSGGNSWKIATARVPMLDAVGRALFSENRVRFKRYADDFAATAITNVWTGMAGATDKVYVVQTNNQIIERCMLMTTDPGDLVLDPTCGSGTTASVAEEWGRRWITIDCSRVALAIARQRLLTAKFDYFTLRPTSAQDLQRDSKGPWLSDPAGQIYGSCTFDCKTVPHVTLKSIAQNQALDALFQNWETILAAKLAALNKALKPVTKELRQNLALKVAAKQKTEGKKAITDADRRRWELPDKEWKDWEVPFDADPDWPKALRDAVTEYRTAWRQKMNEVNACIAARADQEELVDQPVIDRGKVRVSGPFTMEGIIPAEESMETFAEGQGSVQTEPQNAEAYLDRMIRLLREDGVRFPDNKVMKFSALETLADGSTLHAKGVWANGEKKERQVAVMFGPQYGPLIAPMVEDGIRIAARRGFDDLVFAAFSFDGAAQAAIQEDPDPKLRIHMAQIRPDVNMGDLLKTTVSSQLFTVSGSPRTRVEAASPPLPKRGKDAAPTQYVVHMEGVDIYDPVTNTVRSTGAEKVAAWFLDSDYDGRCFCVCQAFFPDRSAWDKLGKALGGVVDEDAFARLSGTVSLPFPEGEHKRIAIKVIDPRGNEVLRVHRLGKEYD